MGTGDLRVLCTAATGSQENNLSESERAAIAVILSAGFEDENIKPANPFDISR
ncbi:hypothetical protein [Streptomyces sp. ok210]|jgi:hypothetical protein|uniref:hypothetical protein n=1 Tax=Streptomyces sp. ok210 TaxID=1761905 RepID=UPI0008EBF672|nr:hypothetical protein [Streptomyces sp. ok210]SFT23021.1 hypothetical protein SAMN04487982_110286 [Streptomyces sp. ok210]